MAGTSLRVGISQWQMLVAVQADGGVGVAAWWLVLALPSGQSESRGWAVLESLLNRGMVQQLCGRPPHELSRDCFLKITELGELAKLDTRGRRALSLEARKAS